ncbi:hypothetical protein FQR65_LT20296 [Abscondita terminalis]|nr:hypothetical protein FQR65_LT20296 [Abscondita terminalis]
MAHAGARWPPRELVGEKRSPTPPPGPPAEKAPARRETRLGTDHQAMQHGRLADGLPYMNARIERGIGVLEDHLDIEGAAAGVSCRAAPQRPSLPRCAARSGRCRRHDAPQSWTLPQPDSPTRPTTSPWCSARSVGCSARTGRAGARPSSRPAMREAKPWGRAKDLETACSCNSAVMAIRPAMRRMKPVAPGAVAGNGLHQGPGVGVLRAFDHVLGVPHLHQPALAHDADAVRQRRHHGQVMGDPDHGGAGLAHELLHLEQDLALDGDVQRRRGFVGNEEVGPVQQGDGDDHPLAHAAGQLVRIAVQALGRRRHADLDQRIVRLLQRLAAAGPAVGEDGLDHLRADAQHRVQRRHRVLEDHGDAAPPDAAQRGLRQAHQFLPVQQDAAAGDAPRRVDQAHDGVAGLRLARAGLAHQAEDLAALQRKAHAVDRAHRAGRRLEMGLQVAHLQQGGGLPVGAVVAHFWNPRIQDGRPAGRATQLRLSTANQQARPGKGSSSSSSRTAD